MAAVCFQSTIAFGISLMHAWNQGKPSETYLKCLEEVQTISCSTLFSPVTRHEVVQSMSKPVHCSLAIPETLTPSSPRCWLVRQWVVKRRSCSSDGNGIM